MLHSSRYWKNRLGDFKEFGIRLRHVNDMLRKFPDDYIELRKYTQEALNQNHLNLLYCRQEIATIEATERGEL